MFAACRVIDFFKPCRNKDNPLYPFSIAFLKYLGYQFGWEDYDGKVYRTLKLGAGRCCRAETSRSNPPPCTDPGSIGATSLRNSGRLADNKDRAIKHQQDYGRLYPRIDSVKKNQVGGAYGHRRYCQQFGSGGNHPVIVPLLQWGSENGVRVEPVMKAS